MAPLAKPFGLPRISSRPVAHAPGGGGRWGPVSCPCRPERELPWKGFLLCIEMLRSGRLAALGESQCPRAGEAGEPFRSS